MKQVLAWILVVSLLLGGLTLPVMAEEEEIPVGYGPTETPPNPELPAYYNSAEEGYITPVRDQDVFRTCWSFAALACCEAYMIKHQVPVGTEGRIPTAKDLRFAVSQLAWATYTDAYDALGLLEGCESYVFDHYNMHGGIGDKTSLTLMRWTGPVEESSRELEYLQMPYEGFSEDYAYERNAAHVQSVVWISPSDREGMKQLIYEHGAGSINYWQHEDYQNLVTGGYYYPYVRETNHEVTVVGWDDNYSKENFLREPPEDGAWIIKDSHSDRYGDNGYIYISYYDGPANNPKEVCCFYEVEPLNNYDNNYQYDGTCNNKSELELGTNDSVSNVFQAQNDEALRAIAVNPRKPNSDLQISVYLNPQGGIPLSGTRLAEQEVHFDYAGYYTVKLDTPVALKANDRFAVVITNIGDPIPIGVDANGLTQDYDEDGTISWVKEPTPGTSYYAIKTAWQDYSETGSFRIKAYTTYDTEGAATEEAVKQREALMFVLWLTLHLL